MKRERASASEAASSGNDVREMDIAVRLETSGETREEPTEPIPVSERISNERIKEEE